LPVRRLLNSAHRRGEQLGTAGCQSPRQVPPPGRGHDGKKHLKAFTGSDEEIGALIAWLQKQNAPSESK